MKTFSYLLVVFLVSQVLPLKLFASSDLHDTIHVSLTKSIIDTTELENLYVTIRKNRRNLGANYLPLITEYADVALAQGYNKGAMQAYDRIGLQYRYDEVYDSAVMYHNLSLKLALELKDSSQLFYNYNNLGQVYRMQDVCVRAVDYFHKAMEISEALGDEKSSSHTMNSLGATYVVQKNYKQAMHYFTKSNEIASKLDDKRTLAYNYGSMGEVYLLQNQNDSAMYYFVESKKLIVELGSNRGFAVAEHLIGQAHFALNNFTEAERYLKKALDLHIKDGNTRYQALCYAYLGKTLAGKNEIDSATWYLEKGKDIAQSIHSYENLILINNSLFSIYQDASEWEKAVSSLQQSHIYQDSIINIENAKQIQSLEVEYETDKQKQQIKLLSFQNEVKSQRIKLGFGLIAILLLSIGLGIYFQIMRKRQSVFKQEMLKQQLLRSQMNPHFLFNALGSIQNFMYKNETKKAAGYLGNFASLTRSILEHSAEESVSLSDEIEMLRNYIELEKMRLAGKFNYKIDIDESIETEFINVPPMLLQPFVENAIKHGMKNLDYQGELLLQYRELGNKLEIKVIDNGHGINSPKAEEAKTHRSMSMQIFKERRAILSKKFKKEFEFNVIDRTEQNDTNKGTEVTIIIPV